MGVVHDGLECLAAIERERPDVITLDVNMPGLDGIATLEAILDRDPTIRVLMVSAETQIGASTTVGALELGAADFVP